jgi:hypothetical protein
VLPARVGEGIGRRLRISNADHGIVPTLSVVQASPAIGVMGDFTEARHLGESPAMPERRSSSFSTRLPSFVRNC